MELMWNSPPSIHSPTHADNVVLLGEIDAEKEAASGLQDAELEEVREAALSEKGVDWDFEER